MSEFQDATGRPGPLMWEGGEYPEGEDNIPVHGISWYEAAAYAEFSGKRLANSNTLASCKKRQPWNVLSFTFSIM